MFEADTDNQIGKWHHLLLVLSLEWTQIMLLDFGFPVPQHILAIRPVAQDFVREFNYGIWVNILGQPPTHREDNARLFETTCARLTAAIGQGPADELCRWGNAMRMDDDQPFEISLGMVERALFDRVRLRQDLSLPQPLAQKSDFIRLIINSHREQGRAQDNILEEVENMAHDTWYDEAVRFYNFVSFHEGMTKDEIINDPFDYLSAMIYYAQDCKLIAHLRAVVTDDEALHLENWLDTLTDNQLNIPVADLIEGCVGFVAAFL